MTPAQGVSEAIGVGPAVRLVRKAVDAVGNINHPPLTAIRGKDEVEPAEEDDDDDADLVPETPPPP